MTGGGNRSQPQVVKTRVDFHVCLVCFTMNKSEQKMTNVTIFLLVSSDLFHYEQNKVTIFHVTEKRAFIGNVVWIEHIDMNQ